MQWFKTHFGFAQQKSGFYPIWHLIDPKHPPIVLALIRSEQCSGGANGAVASAAVLHTVGRGFESLFAHHLSLPIANWVSTRRLHHEAPQRVLLSGPISSVDG